MKKQYLKNIKISLTLIICTALLLCIGAGLTLSYLTDSESSDSTLYIGDIGYKVTFHASNSSVTGIFPDGSETYTAYLDENFAEKQTDSYMEPTTSAEGYTGFDWWYTDPSCSPETRLAQPAVLTGEIELWAGYLKQRSSAPKSMPSVNPDIISEENSDAGEAVPETSALQNESPDEQTPEILDDEKNDTSDINNNEKTEETEEINNTAPTEEVTSEEVTGETENAINTDILG